MLFILKSLLISLYWISCFLYIYILEGHGYKLHLAWCVKLYNHKRVIVGLAHNILSHSERKETFPQTVCISQTSPVASPLWHALTLYYLDTWQVAASSISVVIGYAQKNFPCGRETHNSRTVTSTGWWRGGVSGLILATATQEQSAV